jgi:hypothetical protein
MEERPHHKTARERETATERVCKDQTEKWNTPKQATEVATNSVRSNGYLKPDANMLCFTYSNTT